MKLISMKQRVKAVPSSIFPIPPRYPWPFTTYTKSCGSATLTHLAVSSRPGCMATPHRASLLSKETAHLMPLPPDRAVPARNGGVNLINLGGPKYKALCDTSDIVDHISHTVVITVNYVVLSFHINKI